VSKKVPDSLRSLALEVLVYGVFVAAYLLLVLHFLEGWLKGLYDRNRTAYAFLALLLIAGQGVLLEAATTALLRWFRSRRG